MKLKQTPEDFIVVEKTNIPKKKQGEYLYFWLTKKNYETVKSIQTLAKKLYLPSRKIGFAGNKDKKAITTQLCSIPEKYESRLKNLKIKDLKIEIYGKGDKGLALGDLEGNNFKITIRDIKKAPKKKTSFINFFGEQRFSKNNAKIGKLLVNKQFMKAAKLMTHPEIDEYLKMHPTNPIQAIRTVHKKTLKIYIHSYQSLLWNEMAKTSKEKIIPIIGFSTETKGIEDILKKEKIIPRDFIFPQFKELTSHGTERERIVKVKNLKIGKLQKGKITIEFFLPKGSYATEFIKILFRE